MIATLTFKIHGSSKRVRERSQEFMQQMSRVMGKEIDGTRLVELHCDYSRQSLKALTRAQNDRLIASLRSHGKTSWKP